MEKPKERRKERRLHYRWLIWIAEDFNKALCQGHMVDVCSRGTSFTCAADKNIPLEGQRITSRFSVPYFGSGKSCTMASFTRIGRVCRVEEVDRFVRRVAIQFSEPLPFKPGEQAGIKSESEMEERLKGLTI